MAVFGKLWPIYAENRDIANSAIVFFLWLYVKN